MCINSLTTKKDVNYDYTLSPCPPTKRHKPNPTTPPQYSAGELGKLARHYAHVLAKAGGWPAFYTNHFHQHQKSINPAIGLIPHPAAPFLARLARHGVPAPSTAPPWPTAYQDAAVARGPHPSASRQHTSFLLEDMFDYVRMGYWLVLPYSSLRGHPQLKIAPSGVVPQRDRRPRPIMDYTFNNVNADALPCAPQSSMQFGTALQRILQRIAYANKTFGPPLLAKIDLADGYYRVPLSAHAALNLAVCLPPDGLTEPMLGIPLSLPMGWALSPPYFCAFTETCADLTNAMPQAHPNHPHNHAATPQIPTPMQTTFDPTAAFPYNPAPPSMPLQHTDVYIDDFMLVAQQPTHQPLMHTLLHHLHSIFADTTDSPRRTIVSQSKVTKGDATFSTHKRLLGWDIDTHRLTIHLPPHRAERLGYLLTTTLNSTYTTRKKWQRLLGELHSMVPALHSAKYLFSILHRVLANKPGRRFRISSLTKRALQDWVTLLNNISRHPVPIAHLIPHAPHFYAATDASKDGMGGVSFSTILTDDAPPMAWRYKWPESIPKRLVSADNPQGNITINELELTAMITGHSVLPHRQPPQLCTTTAIATDNTAAAAWVRSGATSLDNAAPYLLRLLAHECQWFNSSLQPVFTPGSTNTIADFISRSFHLTDAELRCKLNLAFPTKLPWTLVTPPAHVISEVNWALSKKMPPKAYHREEWAPTIHLGPSGQLSAATSPVTHSSKTFQTLCPSSKFSLTDTEAAHLLPPALQCDLERWRQPFEPWGRRSPHWATKIPGCNHLGNWTYDSSGNFRHTQKMTRLHLALNQSHCKSSSMW